MRSSNFVSKETRSNDSRSLDRWKKLAIIEPGDTFRSVLQRVMSNYKGEEKTLICSILAWLSNLTKDDDILYHPLTQNIKQYCLLHVIAEQLGLKHFTIDYRKYRFYCQKHKKVCATLFEGYNHEHDCTDYEFRRSKISLHRLAEQKHVYIIAPDINFINGVDDLVKYLFARGDFNKRPFIN